MKKVAIAGPTGMLGSMVYNIFKDKYHLILIYRNKTRLKKLGHAYGGVSDHKKVRFDFEAILPDYISGFTKKKTHPSLKKLMKEIGPVDAFINCAGIINKYAITNPSRNFALNSLLPHLLSSLYKEKLIHVATDCVYNGLTGAPYSEDSPHSPTDLYGLTKSLGEPVKYSLVLRTSLIGPEIDHFTSILEWLKKQRGHTVSGFTNHIWNGVTTRQFAFILQKIIDRREKFPKNGLFHIYSTAISKYKILTSLREKYQLDVTIKPYATSPGIDRRLTSRYNLCKMLKIPSYEEMLKEL